MQGAVEKQGTAVSHAVFNAMAAEAAQFEANTDAALADGLHQSIEQFKSVNTDGKAASKRLAGLLESEREKVRTDSVAWTFQASKSYSPSIVPRSIAAFI